MRNTKYLTGLLLLLLAAVFPGCNKDTNTFIDYKPYLNTARDYANAQQLTTRLINTMLKAGSDSVLNTTGINTDIDKAKCTFVYDSVSDSSFYEAEYNSWGTIDPYQRRRGGIIRIALDGPVSDSGVSGSINLVNFHYEFDSLKAINFRFKNEGTGSNGNRIYRFSADSLIWEVDTNRTISWQFDQLYEQKSDNIDSGFIISGNLNGISYYNISFSAVIADSSRLFDNMDCNWLKDGIVYLSYSDVQNSQMLFPPDNMCMNYYQYIINDNRFDGLIENFYFNHKTK